MPKKLLVIQVAAFDRQISRGLECEGLDFNSMQNVFPALTCVAQASFRTASGPAEHGMVSNGLFHRDLSKVMFWEQSSALVGGRRIWSEFRGRGKRIAMLFWQQSLGEDADIILSPAPIHTHGGGMIQDCYSRPDDLYRRLIKATGRPFRLRQYWGPLASAKVGDWIASATSEVITDEQLAPDLCLTYLPTLDYDFQRFGSTHRKSVAAVKRLGNQLQTMLDTARRAGWQVIVFGDYSISSVGGPAVFVNRALLEAGLMKTRSVKGMLYPDLYASDAFAVVDHQIAHVYVRDMGRIAAVEKVLGEVDGIETVMAGLDHPNSGQLVVVSEADRWFAYPWWTDAHSRPDYAHHVDIHNKPGFDPCELFFSLKPFGISQDTSRIGGSHGRADADRPLAWAATFDLSAQVGNVIELAHAVQNWLG